VTETFDGPQVGAGVSASSAEGSCEVELIHPNAVRRVRQALPGARTMQGVAATFQVLSDPTRATIVYALLVEELCVCDVAAVVGLSVSATSHQLKRLRDRRVVGFRKEGRLAYYSLTDTHLRQLVEEGVGRAHEEEHGAVYATR
jgi:DNA-binding transcriptional ArsR family regulator